MRIGYMRPNQEDLNCAIQLKNLTLKNCDKIIKEDHSSTKERSQLENMLANLVKGDKIVVASFFTLADSTRHLMELLDVIESKGAYFHSIQENIDTSHTAGYPFGAIVRRIVDFQSNVISEKTKKGLYDAQKKGVATGRPRKPDKNVKAAITMYESKKYSIAEITEKTGISKSTLYRYLESES